MHKIHVVSIENLIMGLKNVIKVSLAEKEFHICQYARPAKIKTIS